MLIAWPNASPKRLPTRGGRDRLRRRADRRRRALRHRRRLPPAAPTAPSGPTRSSRRATRSAAPGTCSATRASARTRTCTRSATASGRGTTAKAIADGAVDPAATSARPPASTASSEQIRFNHRVVARRVVARGRALDGRASSAPTPASASRLQLRLPVRLHAATTATTRATRPTSRASSTSRAEVVHPQHWPEDLDYAGKRVVVIGSGATAVTLVPALAEHGRARDDAAALADLRRSRCPARDPLADAAAPACCPREAAYSVVRWKNVLLALGLFSSAAARRGLMRRLLRSGRRAPAARGLRRRHALQPALRPVGPAAVRRARRRPVRGDLRGAAPRS